MNQNVNQTRANQTVHPDRPSDLDAEWKNPTNLDAPPPRPGYRQRWVRISIRGAEDNANISKAFREGWKKREWDTVPAEWQSLKVDDGRFSGGIGVHGLILCEIPEQRIVARDRWLQQENDRMTQAIENDLANDFRRVPLVQKTMQSDVALGRRPKVADDSD